MVTVEKKRRRRYRLYVGVSPGHIFAWALLIGCFQMEAMALEDRGSNGHLDILEDETLQVKAIGCFHLSRPFVAQLL